MSVDSVRTPAAGVVRSLLRADHLARIVSAAYPVSTETRCELLAIGDNDNYLVRDRGRNYLLRVVALGKPWPCRESDFRYEIELLLHLQRDGLPVAPPLPRRDGEYVTVVDAPEGLRPMALFTYMPGKEDPFPPSRDRLHVIGRTLAGLHRSLDSFSSGQDRYRLDLDLLLEAPLGRTTAHLRGRGLDEAAAHLNEVAERIRPHLAEIPATASALGPISGDFHGHNYHFGADGNIILFDFDLCGIGWRAYDIAVWLWYARKRIPDADAFERWRGLLEGYQSVRALLPAERAALPWLAMTREIWLMGAHVADVPMLGSARLTDEYWATGGRRLRDWCLEQETETGRALFDVPVGG